MTNTIILLEERKEITTVLLDDGDKTLVDVITPTGTSLGYEYSNKCMVDDILCISNKSEIGKESLKKYTGEEIPIGILVNDPVVMTNGEREGSVLLLGGIYRLKWASGQININECDRIKLTSNGAVVDDEGDFIAFHPVVDSDKYNYINCFRIGVGGKGEKGDTGDTGPQGVTVKKGETGAKGDTGEIGPQGYSTIIKGSYATYAELIAAHPTGTTGDAYLVNGELYVYQ